MEALGLVYVCDLFPSAGQQLVTEHPHTAWALTQMSTYSGGWECTAQTFWKAELWGVVVELGKMGTVKSSFCFLPANLLVLFSAFSGVGILKAHYPIILH